MGQLTLQEAAEKLGVSQATVRNWMKNGKLQATSPEGRRIFFDKVIVNALNQKIAEGEITSLQQRRNKRAVSGNFIATRYVNYQPYLHFATQVLHIATTIQNPYRNQIVLLEMALEFLMQTGHIVADIADMECSAVEGYMQNHFEVDAPYQVLLHQLVAIDSGDVDATVITQLRKMKTLGIPYIEGEDFLGLLYMALSNLGERKGKGSYYTPTDIAEQLTAKVLAGVVHNQSNDGDNQPIKILDPCCGSGNFLIRAFLQLRDTIDEKILIRDVIRGYDNDSVAVALAALNLVLLMRERLPTESLSLPMVDCRNTLQDDCADAGTCMNQRFDVILGNPPWGSRFNREQIKELKARYQTTESSPEACSMFIEWGIDNLHKGGLLAYVLPTSLLHVTGHRKLRKLVLEKTNVLAIESLGNRFAKVFAPAMSVIFEKADLNRDQKQDQKITVNGWDYDTNFIPQSRFHSNPYYIMNVQASSIDCRILETMKNQLGVKFLKGHAEFALGIVTGNNREYILETCPDDGEVVIQGSDIFKYNYSCKKKYIVFDSARFQQTASECKYRAKEKLFYRFINNSLIFAYDNQQRVSLNSANLLIPKLEGYSILYILAVLNSRAAQFFYQKTFSSIKVLRNHIESIPIPPCDFTIMEEIEHNIRTLLNTEDAIERLLIYEKIDSIIMEVYQLSNPHKLRIYDVIEHVKFLGGTKRC
ncbi:hypothetical protein BHU72_07035 [Desulfuribacillus stibiiarsenatis]|uniref:site-specific DNA-methyltransferase (adenine-specific) n=1 Tax=Desulfuribacillus stibiiarsenatis TaxID=1390249 RepID=A0A1E5L4N8_9FIRM|nr:TaqI-like C-terminal specificity domain-containing protein [Desulfuribacillus stibiiarsenatis]OEH84939.1 hypothetical protein BHU72_07035 [Desulfuribacillus stibiiarsenatis]